MSLSKEEEINAILTDVHRRKQIEHGVTDEQGNKIERGPKSNMVVQSKNPRKYFGEFRSKEKIRRDDR